MFDILLYDLILYKLIMTESLHELLIELLRSHLLVLPVLILALAGCSLGPQSILCAVSSVSGGCQGTYVVGGGVGERVGWYDLLH